jgi:hypothetical protein
MLKFMLALFFSLVFSNISFGGDFPTVPGDCGSFPGVGTFGIGYEAPCYTDFLEENDSVETSRPYYPYAKRPNGCSMPGSKPGEYDSFDHAGIEFSFTEPCNTHDRCYYNPDSNTSAENCNATFWTDLMSECGKAWTADLSIADILSGGSIRTVAYAGCIASATSITVIVESAAFQVFEKARASEAEYLRRFGLE